MRRQLTLKQINVCHLCWGGISISRRVVTHLGREGSKDITLPHKFLHWFLTIPQSPPSAGILNILWRRKIISVIWKTRKKELFFWSIAIDRVNCLLGESSFLPTAVLSSKFRTTWNGLGVTCLLSLSLRKLTQMAVFPSGIFSWSPAPWSCLFSRFSHGKYGAWSFPKLVFWNLFYSGELIHTVPSIRVASESEDNVGPVTLFPGLKITVSWSIWGFSAIAFVQHIKVTSFGVKLWT